MENLDKNKGLSYIQYRHVNNLYVAKASSK